MALLPPVFTAGHMKDVAIHMEGALAVEDSGVPRTPSGPSETFLCLPGLGDFRQSYRFLAPLLFSMGHRVLLADLRGFGESSAGFLTYTPLNVSADIIAILRYLGIAKPVILVANSLSAALHVAATEPSLVKSVIGLCPVVRDMPQDVWFRPLSYILFAWPWGGLAWVSYFETLFKKGSPPDMRSYLAALKKHMGSDSGMRLASVGAMVRGSRELCYKTFGQVKQPVLLIYGAKDPDFSNPIEEALEVVKALCGTKKVKYEVIAGVGHYPHVEDVEMVYSIITDFLKDL